MSQQANTLLDRIGRILAAWLRTESSGYEPYTPSDFETLHRTLQPGDILLIEGNQRISAAIKYLTQSTWSHAALYVGEELPEPAGGGERPRLVEVNLGEGCVAVPLSKYRTYNTRICRASGLTPDDRQAIVRFMTERLGLRYDMRNIFDLLRYFLPTPPVPVRWRRRMIALGSGDPTRAICSTLIAQAYQAVGYPILPEIPAEPGQASAQSDYSRREILHIRHHSLFTPRDFDLSPYFQIVKPTLVYGFDYKKVKWVGTEADSEAGRLIEAASQKFDDRMGPASRN
ncbi:permuted papain-like amidase YaeF/Yiix C92 family enzyme [Mesorhizobium sp. J18]|uniref:YiiX/YebB-like N1pC/P60 family cysteine hydrolase n=1 Tax=Mesorhizobium sp. J18 TaxID=935263 RepID=UPI00119BFFD9|nr:YiiX/YebB-like N1pC/P60 family cysteine hydrolase [Mesorhizobium sp. J18]TWG91370.1 permuted papain-like amidase YaeF/Yiix C92 family enzyme [Mesorhizobium sp. J18]